MTESHPSTGTGPFALINYAQAGDTWVATCARQEDAHAIRMRFKHPDDCEIWNLGACLTVPQAAAEAGCSKEWLLVLIHDGRLPAVKDGWGVRGTWLIRREDLARIPERTKHGRNGR